MSEFSELKTLVDKLMRDIDFWSMTNLTLVNTNLRTDVLKLEESFTKAVKKSLGEVLGEHNLNVVKLIVNMDESLINASKAFANSLPMLLPLKSHYLNFLNSASEGNSPLPSHFPERFNECEFYQNPTLKNYKKLVELTNQLYGFGNFVDCPMIHKLWAFGRVNDVYFILRDSGIFFVTKDMILGDKKIPYSWPDTYHADDELIYAYKWVRSLKVFNTYMDNPTVKYACPIVDKTTGDGDNV